ncbi:MAG: hypothetical protein KC502_13195 [Myxococcales bacterium]|nr:hypothetical protein [Myxococcales bacterium]
MMRRISKLGLLQRLLPLVAVQALIAPMAYANGLLVAGDTQGIKVDGWAGFLDIDLLLNFLSALVLAAVLSLVVGWGPKPRRPLERMSGAAAPLVLVLYAVVGAVIGTVVVHYGMGVGLVVFGIGGLMRFRSNMATPESTGRVILATVIGLCSGMQLPHVAVTATVFTFVVLVIFSRTVSYRLLVKGLAPENLAAAAAAYRKILMGADCAIVGEKKSYIKGQVAFLLRTRADQDPDELVRLIAAEIPEELRGGVDWDIG